MLTSKSGWLFLMAVSAGLVRAQAPAASNPFEFFDPQVAVTADERARLARGESVVKALAPAPREVAIFSAARADFNGDRLVAWVRRIEALKQGSYVPAVGRFSDPPRIEDLASLELDRSDLDELRSCRAGSCGVKLSEAEIRTLRDAAGSRNDGWEPAVQQAFREVMLARAQAYLRDGLLGAAPYRDRDEPVVLNDEFQIIISNSAFLSQRMPGLVQFLTHYPNPQHTPGAFESFLYWSKELLGRRPIVSITHVAIARHEHGPLPEALVAARQVFATHYMNGSLSLTGVVGGRDGTPRYLVYLNRSRVDLLDGLFAGVVRRIGERRLRNEAGQVVESLRKRLTAGDPPPLR